MFSKSIVKVGLIALVLFGSAATVAYASHSWSRYHWARTTNPFALKVGDNVSAVWDSHLATASTDWRTSSVLDTTVVTGQAGTDCLPVNGRVEVCNNAYGNNGWLGIAQIWVAKGTHITKGVAKMNDTYFNNPPYNTAARREFVMCQEIGHTFGLNHQDENFNNANLGTCMDYTSDPDGTLADPDQQSNEHPNAHDYAQLVTIYTHLDKITTIAQTISNFGFGNRPEKAEKIDLEDLSMWGKSIRKDARGKDSLFERDFGGGNKVFTFVIWAN